LILGHFKIANGNIQDPFFLLLSKISTLPEINVDKMGACTFKASKEPIVSGTITEEISSLKTIC
jgi:hypothetical protein